MMEKTRILAFLMLIALLGLSISSVSAGDISLNNNSDDGNTIWFIEGEPSLVMNGFDLSPLNLEFPVIMDAVSISVRTPIPETPINIVVYQDADGGSPANATLAGRSQTTINSAGVARLALEPGIVIDQPVVWVGFYLPVGFEFYADRSGTSVLTYWAWTPGGIFDLNDLSTAQALGPADGSDPIGLDMKGVARITAELRTATSQEIAEGLPLGVQVVDSTGVDLSPMLSYEYCNPLRYDTEDIRLSARDSFDLHCRVDFVPGAPAEIEQPEEKDFERRGFLYDVSAFGNYRKFDDNAEELVVPVTHCISPELIDLETAVVGIAYGIPRKWHILPTVRFGETICAEVTHIGNISYFVPRSGSEANVNANLTFASIPTFTPHPLECGSQATILVDIRNNGTEPTGANTYVRVESTLVRNGAILAYTGFHIPSIEPGKTHSQTVTLQVNAHYNEMHRTTIVLDWERKVFETNEDDNTYSTDYLLAKGKCP